MPNVCLGDEGWTATPTTQGLYNVCHTPTPRLFDSITSIQPVFDNCDTTVDCCGHLENQLRLTSDLLRQLRLVLQHLDEPVPSLEKEEGDRQNLILTCRRYQLIKANGAIEVNSSTNATCSTDATGATEVPATSILYGRHRGRLLRRNDGSGA